MRRACTLGATPRARDGANAPAKVSTIVVIVTAYFGYRVLQNLGVSKDNAKKSPDAVERGNQCRLYKDPENIIQAAEDIRPISAGVFLSGSFPLIDWFDSSNPSWKGDILAYHPETERVRKVPLEGMPAGTFRPHGISFSNSTKKLYVVNHQDDHPRIEIFQVVNPDSFESVALKHVKTIVVAQLGKGMVNSVAEGALDGSDIYLTQWIATPLPAKGSDHPSSASEVLNALRGIPLALLQATADVPFVGKLGSTGVWRCVVATGECEKLEGGMYMANGLAFTPDRAVLYVVDLLGRTISLYTRDAKTGQLTFKFIQDTPHAVDNIDIRPVSGGDNAWEMILGTIPDLLAYVTEAVVKDKRPLAGGVMTAKKISWALGFKDVVIHSGTKVSTLSTGAKAGDKILAGGPKTKGVLVC